LCKFSAAYLFALSNEQSFIAPRAKVIFYHLLVN